MEITGRVVGLGETHFELADEADHRHRFGVAMDVQLEAGELARLEREGTRVVVVYDDNTPEPVAYRVFAAPRAAAATP